MQMIGRLRKCEKKGQDLLPGVILDKCERKYRIRHKVTGKYYSGYSKYKRTKNSGSKRSLVPVFQSFPRNFGSVILSATIKKLIYDKSQSVLDDCEIETIEVREVLVKGTLRMKNILCREEQKVIIEKLKYDQ